MTGITRQGSVWPLVRAQDEIITHDQLVALGYSRHAIAHRIARGRMHRVFRGVYKVGSPQMSERSWWMASVLRCGEGTALSHAPATVHWGIRRHARVIEVSTRANCRPPGIVVHRRSAFEITTHNGIPVTTPTCTIVDMAPRLPPNEIEDMISQADIKKLIDLPSFIAAVDELKNRPGAKKVKQIIHRRTFRMTRSELERRFIPLAVSAGLPVPLTRQIVNGFEVDFYWPDLELVVETDGWAFHRTPAQRAEDLRRDQIHATTEVERLRFSHGQIAFEPSYVRGILAAVACRLCPAP